MFLRMEHARRAGLWAESPGGRVPNTAPSHVGVPGGTAVDLWVGLQELQVLDAAWFLLVGPSSHLRHDTLIIGLISDRRYPDRPSLPQRCGPCKASRCRGSSGGPWEDTFKS